jgi:hypothetical protein
MPYYKLHRPEPIVIEHTTNMNRIYKDFCPYFETSPDCIANNCICIKPYVFDTETVETGEEDDQDDK